MTSESEQKRTPLLGLNPGARRLLPVFMVVLVALTVWRLGFQDSPQALYEFNGATMGTTYSVKLAARKLPHEEHRRIAETIDRRLSAVNRLMSTWDQDSELSRFNRFASTDAFAVSPQTLEVFRVAREVSALTEGAFDVTVGPLVAAWGFGATDRAPAPPLPSELAALRERVGYRLVEIDLASQRLRKVHPETVCDLSAIAKGYGVDEVARALVEFGQHDFLVEVGGELRAEGQRAEGRAWRVAIEQPHATARSIFGVVELKDTSLATSGDYRSYYVQDGRRLSHLIDPRSGHPIAHSLASVTVVHRQAVYADALATGLSVLGPEEGFALSKRQGLAAYFIVREPDGSLRGLATPEFPPVEQPHG